MIVEMHLLNDTSQAHDTSFIRNVKKCSCETDREREREKKKERERRQVKSERQSVAEKGLWHGS
jgi:hypothetical protein